MREKEREREENRGKERERERDNKVERVRCFKNLIKSFDNKFR